LDDYATLGLDIYISELDISTSTSNNIVLEEHQLKKYQDLFPVMWEHPAVKGVTLWGYKEGKTWIPDTYLIREDGTERSAMKWLSDYMNSVVKNPVDCTIRARGSSGFEKIRVVIDDKVVKEFNLSVLWKEYSFTGDFGKDIKVEYFNDKKWSTGLLKNVTIDYLKVDDKIYQAEDQEQNTGVYTKFKCGGIKSEKLHCNGYILFKLNEITLSKGTDEPKIRPIETPTKINQNKIERNLLVFPNPSKGIFSIKLDEPKGVMVDIYDFSGKLLDSFNLMNNKEKIVEIKTNLLKGTYLVNVKNQNSKQSSILLVE
ncbi:MAG: endo-1,4-beta-xylanase, partial [Solirubrobacteraceae bacterium]